MVYVSLALNEITEFSLTPNNYGIKHKAVRLLIAMKVTLQYKSSR